MIFYLLGWSALALLALWGALYAVKALSESRMTFRQYSDASDRHPEIFQEHLEYTLRPPEQVRTVFGHHRHPEKYSENRNEYLG